MSVKDKVESFVSYDGRLVPQNNFRVFIYGIGEDKSIISHLVNSWSEYQEHIASGVWYSKKEDVTLLLDKQKSKKKGD